MVLVGNLHITQVQGLNSPRPEKAFGRNSGRFQEYDQQCRNGEAKQQNQVNQMKCMEIQIQKVLLKRHFHPLRKT